MVDVNIQPMVAKIAPGIACLKLIFFPFLMEGLNLYNKVNIKIINDKEMITLKYFQNNMKFSVIPRKSNSLLPKTSPKTKVRSTMTNNANRARVKKIAKPLNSR